MSSLTTAISLPASRPKVHRLPPKPGLSPTHSAMMTVLGYGKAAKLLFTFASLATLSALLGLAARDISWLGREQAPVVERADIAAASGASGSTIVLKSQEGTIIGQMAKMPPQIQGTVAIGAVSAVDNSQGQELLSIINRY